MAGQAREAIGKTKLEAIADRGYFSGHNLKRVMSVLGIARTMKAVRLAGL